MELKKAKVFISQPMNGLDEKEVLETRSTIFENFKKHFGYPIELIDSYVKENIPLDAGRIWMLGDSIKLMDQADIIIFAPGWRNARGCEVEHLVADKYGINRYM